MYLRISPTYRKNEYNNKYLYLKRELFYMVLVFLRLRRNFVERNAVITSYRDFLSSPTNGPGYCWSDSCDSWFGKEWLGSNPTKWWTGDKRVVRYLMKKITANQYQTFGAITRSQRFSLRINEGHETESQGVLKDRQELSLSINWEDNPYYTNWLNDFFGNTGKSS